MCIKKSTEFNELNIIEKNKCDSWERMFQRREWLTDLFVDITTNQPQT